MRSYGVFNDERMLDGPFYGELGRRDAEDAAWRYRENYRLDLDDGDDQAEVKELCEDHPDEPADTCEECFVEVDDLSLEEEPA